MRCTRCVMDSSIPNIVFDEKGVCNFCKLHDKWNTENPTNGLELNDMLKRIKQSGTGKKYDCIVGISGGGDSSYLLHLAKDVWKLKPLTMHFDNGWNSSISTDNMEKMIRTLNVDLYKVTVDREEFNDICKSFLKASVCDADIPNDIGMTAAFYQTAELFDVKTVLIGHSFRAEGTIPLGWTYMDGKYIDSVQKKFGSIPLKTLPNMWLRDWMEWLILDRIKILRPFWYMDYNPDEARKMLTNVYGWEWYKAKHGENKYTKFITYYYLYKKFRIDKRLVRLSAPVRSGFMTRDDALKVIHTPPEVEPEIIEEIKEKLHISDSEFEEIMKAPIHTHFDYETYQSTFKRLKPFFRLMSSMNLIPKTFYTKYVG